MKPHKPRLFPAIHRRIRELDLTYLEVADRIGISGPELSMLMSGRRAWRETYMQRLLDEIAQPEETLADFWPRRKL